MNKKYLDISHFINVRTQEQVKIDLAARFASKRKQAKITQKQLAKLSGVSYGSIRRFESSGEISLSSLISLSSSIQSLLDFDQLFTTPFISDPEKEWKNEHKNKTN